MGAKGGVTRVLRHVGCFVTCASPLLLVMSLSIELISPIQGYHCQTTTISQTITNATTSQPEATTPSDKKQVRINQTTIDFKVLASEFQQDTLKTDTLIKVINDTHGIDESTRTRLYNLIKECLPKPKDQYGDSAQQVPSGKQHREIVYEDTIFTKRALREIESKMNMSYEGESKSDPAIHWVILYNDTTILVVRSANKYYYWTYGQSVGSLIIFCMIVVGNLSILHRLKSCRRRRSNVNYFIVQLAIADLLVGIFSVTLDSWLRIQKAFLWGLFACRASKYISALFIYSSTNLLVALSVDRWEAVVKPLAFTRNRSRGYHLVAASWLLAFITALPVTFFTKIKEIDGLPQCWIDLNSYGWRLYMIYLTSLLLIMPTLIIAVCYIHIVYTIWSKGRLVASQQQKRERNTHNANTTTTTTASVPSYCASPESLGGHEFSSSRLTSSFRSGEFHYKQQETTTSAHRTAPRWWITWLRRQVGGGGKHRQPLGNIAEIEAPKSETTTTSSGSRRASTDTSATASGTARSRRLEMFKRSRTIEIGPEDIQRHDQQQQQQRGPHRDDSVARSLTNSDRRRALDGKRAANQLAPSSSASDAQNNESPELNNSKLSRDKDSDGGGGNLDLDNGQVSRHGDHREQRLHLVGANLVNEVPPSQQSPPRATLLASGEIVSDSKRNHAPETTRDTTTTISQSKPLASALARHQFPGGKTSERNASRGLRILSFARSHSSSSPSSSGLSTSSPVSSSSSSSLTSKSARPAGAAAAVSVSSSVANQIMLASTMLACSAASSHRVASAQSVSLGRRPMMAAHVDRGVDDDGVASIGDGDEDNDRRHMTVVPDVGEREVLGGSLVTATTTAISAHGPTNQHNTTNGAPTKARGSEDDGSKADRVSLIHERQGATNVAERGEPQSGYTTTTTTTSSGEQVEADKPKSLGRKEDAVKGATAEADRTTMKTPTRNTKDGETGGQCNINNSTKTGLLSKEITNMITMTTSKGQHRLVDGGNKYGPTSKFVGDMQTDSHAISSSSCDKKTSTTTNKTTTSRKWKRNGGLEKQFGQVRTQHLQQSPKPRPLQVGAVANIEPPSSSGGGRDQDFVAQQHGSGVIPKARIKTIKMTLVIVVAYILCWSPFLILNLCSVFGLIKNDTNVSHAVLTLSQSLAHLNSAVNPIIFWLFSSRRSQTNANTAGLTAAGLAPTNQHANNNNHNNNTNHHHHQLHTKQQNKRTTNGSM